MKNLTVLLFGTTLFLAATGCGHGHTHEQHGGAESQHQSGSGAVLSLDQGKKWKVNSEMMVHVKAMEAEINGFTAGENLDTYHDLAGRLRIQGDGITGSCTMEGKAHDELHIWLLPHLELIQSMKSASDVKDAQKNFQAIQKSMKEFHEYFE